jgi:beta-lactamase superfamily II metal-dependent hydrolase
MAMRTLIWTSLALAVAVLAMPPGARAQGELTIIHFDVGQGDSTLIIAPSGKTLLIDGGNQGEGAKVVVPRLKSLGVKKLDYVIATHFDADHIGGLDEVLKAMGAAVGVVLDHGNKGPLKRLKRKKIKATRYGDYAIAAVLSEARNSVTLGRGVIDLGAGVTVTIVAVNGCVLGGGADQYRKRLDKNGASVTLVITFGDFDYFIGGDLTGGGRYGRKITEDMETPVAAKVGRIDALRLNHHGSNTSSNKFFLETLRPMVVVVSVGDGYPNTRYRHPARAVLKRLHDIEALGLKAVYATNKGETTDGLSPEDRDLITVVERDVVIRSDGYNFSVDGDQYLTDGEKSPAAGAAVPAVEACASHRRAPDDVSS